jgi:hypothetical protein
LLFSFVCEYRQQEEKLLPVYHASARLVTSSKR